MRAVKQCRDRGGDLSIVGVSDRALRVMKLLSLDRMVRLYPQGP
jgi:anti-anti-sigma regulatory factor